MQVYVLFVNYTVNIIFQWKHENSHLGFGENKHHGLSRSCIEDVSHVFHLLCEAPREQSICTEVQFCCTLSMHLEMRQLCCRAFKTKLKTNIT